MILLLAAGLTAMALLRTPERASRGDVAPDDDDIWETEVLTPRAQA